MKSLPYVDRNSCIVRIDSLRNEFVHGPVQKRVHHDYLSREVPCPPPNTARASWRQLTIRGRRMSFDIYVNEAKEEQEWHTLIYVPKMAMYRLCITTWPEPTTTLHNQNACESEAGYLVGLPYLYKWLCRLNISVLANSIMVASSTRIARVTSTSSGFQVRFWEKWQQRWKGHFWRWRICCFKWRWSFPIRSSVDLRHVYEYSTWPTFHFWNC